MREFARTLTRLNASGRAVVIEDKDQKNARRIATILRPGGAWSLPVRAWIRVWENDLVPSVIATLTATWNLDQNWLSETEGSPSVGATGSF